MKRSNPSFCYWSVADGSYSKMFGRVIASARDVGVTQDFHLWSDSNVDGARMHPLGKLDKFQYLFKLQYLQEHVSKLKYDYFVWLDADTFFVRHPGDIISKLTQGDPVHSSLESDATSPYCIRKDWWRCPLPQYIALMKRQGVLSRSIYNVNAGLWIVHRDVIGQFCHLAWSFWNECNRLGFQFTEEAPLAYATHMLVGDPYRHTLKITSDIWASDWCGYFADRIPDGLPWWFEDYFAFEKIPVNPAIVHAMRSKEALINY